MQKFKKIFVPGAAGFVGQSVVKALKEKGLDFVALSLEDGVDFRNFSQTKEIFEKEKFDAVINCSAFIGGIKFGIDHCGEIFYNNILMAANLMECARLAGVKRFVNPISNCSYPARLNEFKEEEWWDGPLHESVLTYGFVRKASYIQGWSYQKQYGFDSVHLILPNMYGPGDHFDEVRSHALGALIMKFVQAKEKNDPQVTIWGTGAPIREWLYVEDGTRFLVKALEIDPIIDPINIGVGQGISIADLADLIKETVGYQGKIIYDTAKPDGAPCKIMIASRSKEIFGITPQIALKEGIQKTVAWYLKNKTDL